MAAQMLPASRHLQKHVHARAKCHQAQGGSGVFSPLADENIFVGLLKAGFWEG